MSVTRCLECGAPTSLPAVHYCLKCLERASERITVEDIGRVIESLVASPKEGETNGTD